MEGNMYKELSYKMQRFRIVSWLIGAVVLLLCLLIGIGCYILVVGMNGRQNAEEIVPIKEEITIIEGKIRDPASRRAQALQERELTSLEEGAEALAHLKHASSGDFVPQNSEESAEIHPNSYKTSFSMRYPPVVEAEEAPEQDGSLFQTLAALADTSSNRFFDVINKEDSKKYMEQTLQFLEDYAAKMSGDEESHSRQKRAIGASILGFFPYLSYASFGKFMFNQVSEIAQYKMESRSFQARKLGGDPEAEFLDNLYWPSNTVQKTVKKSSAVAEEVSAPVEEQKQPANKPWTPMVNQVPIHFVGEILRTLLNLMKEFLMKDHVMECLWFMFCQDVNHQATHSDVYGILARVNR